MNELVRMAGLLRSSVFGPAWHGDSLLEVLHGMSAQDALRTPGPEVHCGWEISSHIVVWERVARLRIEGRDPGSIPDAEDWPETGRERQDWQATLSRLRKETDRLCQTILQMPEERLWEEGPDGLTLYQMIHGVIHHNLYHAGQIALLKKLQAIEPKHLEA